MSPVPASSQHSLPCEAAPYQYVEILWLDAIDEAGWHEVKDLMSNRGPSMVSRGWLVAQNEDMIWLAGTIDCRGDMETVSSVGGIPRGMVRSMKVLEL